MPNLTRPCLDKNNAIDFSLDFAYNFDALQQKGCKAHIILGNFFKGNDMAAGFIHGTGPRRFDIGFIVHPPTPQQASPEIMAGSRVYLAPRFRPEEDGVPISRSSSSESETMLAGINALAGLAQAYQDQIASDQEDAQVSAAPVPFEIAQAIQQIHSRFNEAIPEPLSNTNSLEEGFRTYGFSDGTKVILNPQGDVWVYCLKVEDIYTLVIREGDMISCFQPNINQPIQPAAPQATTPPLHPDFRHIVPKCKDPSLAKAGEKGMLGVLQKVFDPSAPS